MIRVIWEYWKAGFQRSFHGAPAIVDLGDIDAPPSGSVHELGEALLAALDQMSPEEKAELKRQLLEKVTPDDVQE